MPNEQTSVPLYAASEVLTAANMNISAGTGVPVFATTVTRDAAFGGAGEKVLAEGQLCYLSATNVVQYYDGAAWATVGPAAAPVSNRVVRTSGNVTTTSTSLVDVTGATITLTTGTNRIAYGVAQSLSTLLSGNFFNFNIDLDGTLLHGTSGIKFVDPAAPTNFNGSFSGLSDTLTAGSHTIKLQFMVNTGTGTIVATTAIAQMFYAYEIA